MEEPYLWDVDNPEGYNNQSGRYKTKAEIEFILHHIPPNPARILDLGGGSGRFAVPLTEKGYEVTVVDLNSNAIELCRQRGIPDSFCMDFRSFKGKDFDVVLAIELFLVTPPAEVFKAAFNFLKEKGLFLFIATNRLSWRSRLHNLRKSKTANLGDFSIGEYKQLLDQQGFRIIEIKGFNWLPFRVNSDNKLIPLIAGIEKKLALHKWIGQSPWLMFACEKKRSGAF